MGRNQIGVAGGGGSGVESNRGEFDPFFRNLIDGGLCTMVDLTSQRPDGDPVLDLAACLDLHEILIVRHNRAVKAQKDAESKARSRKRK